jgi:hypothetical protein
MTFDQPGVQRQQQEQALRELIRQHADAARIEKEFDALA